jgi:hypothetical protein
MLRLRAAHFLANYSEIPNSCRAFQLALLVDIHKMLVDGRHLNVEQHGNLRLRQPHRLAVDPDVELKLASGRHVDGVIGCRDYGCAGSGAHGTPIDHYRDDDHFVAGRAAA